MSSNQNPKKKPTKEQDLMSLASNLVPLTDEKNLYVELGKQGARTQLVQVPSASFSSWLTSEYYNTFKKFPNQQLVNGVVAVFQQDARSNASSTKVNLRFAYGNDESYVDMGKQDADDMLVIKIGDWRMETKSCCKFVLEPSIEELTAPAAVGGDPFLLFKTLNITKWEHQLLILAWLCALPLPIEHPILLLQGSHASGKTTAAERIRIIFDKTKPLKMSIPSNEDDLALAFYTNAVCYFDNVGLLSKGVSDMFCKAVTGDGHSKRALYTNSKQIYYEYQRPILMTSITMPTKAEDFLSRCMTIPMDSISSESRFSESDLDDMFKDDLPKIFGGILDLLVHALQLKKFVKLKHRTRMGDFDQIGCAVSMALGIHPKEFMKARLELERSASLSGKDDDFLGAVNQLVEDNGGASLMTAKEMAEDISDRLELDEDSSISTHSIGKKLSSNKDALKTAGITVKKIRQNNITSYSLISHKPEVDDLVEVLPHCSTCRYLDNETDVESVCKAYGKCFSIPVNPVKCPEYSFMEKEWVQYQLDIDDQSADSVMDMADFFNSKSEEDSDELYLDFK